MKLPKTNEYGFYEIRLESIGGLGANLAGKMLAEAGILGSGLDGSNFASYGSEKKGSPVKSFIRFCEEGTEIRDHSPVEKPHVIGVFHEALYTTVDVVKGLQPDGILLVNTISDFDQVSKELKVNHGTIAIVDATKIANEEKTRINTAMLGALFRVCDFLDPDVMRDVIRRAFERKAPHFVEPNIRTFNRGYEEVQLKNLGTPQVDIEQKFEREQAKYGYNTQTIGGVILANGNSLEKSWAGSRTGFIPNLDMETCIHCAQCDTVCPDYCFVWESGEDKRGRKQMFLKGIDYQYCKGCMKCVSACPTAALSTISEPVGYATENRTPQQIPYNKRGEE